MPVAFSPFNSYQPDSFNTLTIEILHNLNFKETQKPLLFSSALIQVESCLLLLGLSIAENSGKEPAILVHDVSTK